MNECLSCTVPGSYCSELVEHENVCDATTQCFAAVNRYGCAPSASSSKTAACPTFPLS
jgi:hypothetical protein